ncbi:MAG: SAM-dependent chlorinase/fluorinase [Oscillatoriales cyanobacterium RM2_1_1]|nr:SAM-dependent chlorinase/fluorinase [Oscillatoriales cyanobacterium SM2_3_0]NJO47807.1 SAM-dependent chlorinase/fluorinase [Oscillatoriales cyanobacterium RM2_1_1]
MMHPPIITLLTDFGISDVYVGIMKGVIAGVNPELGVIDLTHEIPPQNLIAARFCLMNAIPYFPVGTIHIAVVDPGVGTRRRAIALRIPQGFLVGPDNGLFSGVIERVIQEKSAEAVEVVELTNPRYWRDPHPSATFQGRDIFAPVGAYLASGIPLERFGHPLDPTTLVSLGQPQPEITESGIEGCIQYIDQFGNIVTNISGDHVQGKTWFVAIRDLSPEEMAEKSRQKKKKKDKDKEKSKKEKILNGAQPDVGLQTLVSRMIPGSKTYGDVQPGQLVALVGSHGWIEIAANQGSAQAQLALDWGERVQVLLSEPT